MAQTESRASPGSITDVPGIAVGHYTDTVAATGCTAVLPARPAVAGIDVRGASPGSRETELLRPLATIEQVHGIMLAGGSAFGLEAATGAVRFLEERGIGLRRGDGDIVIPLVPSAIIYDLSLVTHRVRPTADDGYAACVAASATFELGSVGAGTGATIGKLRGLAAAVKGGLGSASVGLGDGLVVGALVVTNPIGSVVDPDTGRVMAGPRVQDALGRSFEDSISGLIEDPPPQRGPALPTSTVIGVVATNASLDRKSAVRLAGAGQDAIAMCVRPAHLSGDGDTMFALATGEHAAPAGAAPPANLDDRLRAAAMRAVCAAILSAVRSAAGLGGIPSAREWLEGRDAG